MSVEVLFSFLPYALVTAYTPGPNNILALNAVTKYGLRGSKNIVVGIISGFFAVMFFCALGCFVLGRVLPFLTSVLKSVGAIYIFYLGLQILKTKPNEDSVANGCSFKTGFALQFLNVKIILYAITVYSAYVLPKTSSVFVLTMAVLFNFIIGSSGVIVWALCGKIFRKFINRHFRFFNFVMCLVLVWCAYNIIFS